MTYPNLCVFQHCPEFLKLAIEDDVDGPRPFHLPQDLLVVILVLEAELVDNSPEVGVSGGLEQLLQPDQALVVLQEESLGQGTVCAPGKGW